ncbi:ankyrin repeat-containing domain protein [Pelagophyceae sp. CCMP2097]|nr:ankyrin repeat-containing domain protein [Pelagophyceae sp. CCMP2097]|eukprot:CAMPEP_0184108940 /NCGR_PEP_ID=MMETSP0974-20121125/16636_1 /TAXON_ID=483370 /ORGANISM="non described non described, Strain CCMP2097" /LENGTH=191 /DNA_ID=CAMNT_0026411973 /DNA_START=22 /DNA_END=597 /DNA_ORIENTATION=+
MSGGGPSLVAMEAALERSRVMGRSLRQKVELHKAEGWPDTQSYRSLLEALKVSDTERKDREAELQRARAALRGSLIEACFLGDLARVQNLLLSGADVEATDATGATPLYAAMTGEQYEVVVALIGSGVDVNAVALKNDGRPLTIAVRNADLRLVRTLVAAGAVPRTPEEEDFVEDDSVRVDIRKRAGLLRR